MIGKHYPNLLQLMNIDPEQLKKIRVRYLKCPKGDLHQGEVLNFICIDSTCKAKGLICPVCQTTQHEQHKTMHLKVFLAEINNNLSDKSQFGGLASHLVSLDTTRRDMQKALKETVQQLSLKIKEVQQKIEKGYSLLRRIVLSQSTVSQRLPQLYRLLTDQTASQSQPDIIKEISRYSELLEFKDNKLITVDSANDLIAEYSNKSGLLGAHLTNVVAQVSKIFASLPLNIDKFGSQQKEEVKSSNIKFSSIKKSSSVNIVNDKLVKLSQNSFSGIAFVEGDTSKEVQTASFKIVETNQGEYISVGVALSQEFQDRNYEINLEAQPGLFGLCSYGILPEELQGEAFLYSKGDTIDVTWTPAEFKLTFSRRHSIQKCETYLPFMEQMDKFAFYVALSSATSKVELVQ